MLDNNENHCLSINKEEEKPKTMKRFLTIPSDDDDKKLNSNSKRQRSSSLLTKTKTLQIANQQPIIRQTRQTSLSIVRTISDDKTTEDKKWNLKLVDPISTSKTQKKKLTQTVIRFFFLLSFDINSSRNFHLLQNHKILLVHLFEQFHRHQ